MVTDQLRSVVADGMARLAPEHQQLTQRRRLVVVCHECPDMTVHAILLGASFRGIWVNEIGLIYCIQDDVIKWKHFSRYWPFVRGIHRSPVNSPHKSQWRGALMYSLICAWTNGWVKNRGTGDMRRHRAYYDVFIMIYSEYRSDRAKKWYCFQILWLHIFLWTEQKLPFLGVQVYQMHRVCTYGGFNISAIRPNKLAVKLQRQIKVNWNMFLCV